MIVLGLRLCDNSFSFSCVSDLDVLESFLKVKSNAIGLENIHPMFLKALLPKLLPFITYIFNDILMQSIYHNSWKSAKMISIPKSNNDFRPISILPYLSKVFQLIIFRQMNDFFLLKINSCHINNQEIGVKEVALLLFLK